MGMQRRKAVALALKVNEAGGREALGRSIPPSVGCGAGNPRGTYPHGLNMPRLSNGSQQELLSADGDALDRSWAAAVHERCAPIAILQALITRWVCGTARMCFWADTPCLSNLAAPLLGVARLGWPGRALADPPPAGLRAPSLSFGPAGDGQARAPGFVLARAWRGT